METKVYNDFSGGWSGTLDLSKVSANMYDARNMVVYRDGYIGPRPGLKLFDLGRSLDAEPYGILYLGRHNRGLAYVDGNEVWLVSEDNDGNNSVNAGTIPVAADPATGLPLIGHRFDRRTGFFSEPGSTPGIFKLESGTPVMVDYTTEGSYSFPIYGVRMLRGDVLRPKIWYSAPDDLTTWPALNFIQVSFGADTALINLTEMKNSMVIVNDQGVFFVLSGVPGINDTLRKVVDPHTRPGTPAALSFVVSGDEMLYYLMPNGNYPAYFDGNAHAELAYLSMVPEDRLYSYADSSVEDTIHGSVIGVNGVDADSVGFILPSHSRMLLKHHGAWGLHEFSTPVSNRWTSTGRGRFYGFAELDGDNTKAYVVDMSLDRPGFTSDLFAQPGDNTATPLDAWVKLPEVWSNDGDLLKVTEVIVDFKKWNTGASVSNRINIEVQSLGRGDRPSVEVGSQTRTWEQATSEAPATLAGEKDRIRWNFAEYEGAGFSVKLSGLRGVAIGEVRVNYELVKSDGRYG